MVNVAYIASSQASCSKTKPAFLLNLCTQQRYDTFGTQTRHVSQLKITDVIFPSCELFYLVIWGHHCRQFESQFMYFRAAILLGCFYNWNVFWQGRWKTENKKHHSYNNSHVRYFTYILYYQGKYITKCKYKPLPCYCYCTSVAFSVS